MKSIIYLLFIITNYISVSAQEIVNYSILPEPVKRFFPAVYKLDDTVQVKWTNEDTLYVARFMSEGFPVEVRMKANGFWVMTLWDVDPIYMPVSIKTYCQNFYRGYSILRSRMTNNPFSEQKYVITLIADENPEDLILLFFSIDGKPTEP